MKKDNTPIAIISIIILFVIGNQFLFSAADVKPKTIDYTDENVIFQDDKSAIYEINYYSDGVREGDCSERDFTNFQFDIATSPRTASSQTEFISGLQQNKIFKTKKITFDPNPLLNNYVCSDLTTRTNTVIDNVEADCSIVKSGSLNNIDRATISCKWRGLIHGEINNQIVSSQVVGGMNRGRLEIEFLKEGVECTQTQLSLCNENQICKNNLCVYNNFEDTEDTEEEKECIQNIDCIEKCWSNIPTCLNNFCSCSDNVIIEDFQDDNTDTNYQNYFSGDLEKTVVKVGSIDVTLMILIIFGGLIFIFYILLK